MSASFETPQGDFLPRVGAGCLVLLGAFLVVSMLFLVPGSQGAGAVIMGVTGIGLLAAGVFWWRFVRSIEQVRRVEFEDKEVLLIAARHAGAVTVAQVALESSLTAARAEQVMARMTAAGIAHPDFLDDGTIVYRFGGLLPPNGSTEHQGRFDS